MKNEVRKGILPNNYKPGPYRIDEDKILSPYRDFYRVEKLYLNVDNVKIDVCEVLIIAGKFYAPLPWICKNPSYDPLYDKIQRLLNKKIGGDYGVLRRKNCNIF